MAKLSPRIFFCSFRIISCWKLLVYLIVYVTKHVHSLRDVQVSVPKVVGSNEMTVLSCRWSLDPGETLYSVKWYRSHQEFYRYLPKEMPHTRVFTHEGIYVDLSQSGEHQVVLRDLTRNLTGHFRCEVSADAPSFHTEQASSYMHIVDLPKSAPILWADKPWYSSGDRLRANCSSGPADPPAGITWLINGKIINGTAQQKTQDTTNTAQSLEPPTTKTAYLEVPITPSNDTDLEPSTAALSAPTEWKRKSITSFLDFNLTAESFEMGVLNLTCISKVATIYSAKAELQLEEEKPQIASVRGTRDTAAGSNIRQEGHLFIFNVFLFSIRTIFN